MRTSSKMLSNNIHIWYNRIGRSLYDFRFDETNSVISSSCVGERRYLAPFLSLNRKSCQMFRGGCISDTAQHTSEPALARRPLLVHNFSDDIDDKETFEAPTTVNYL